MSQGAEGTGITNAASDGTVLDTWFPRRPLRIGKHCDLRHSARVIGVDAGATCAAGRGGGIDRGTPLFDARHARHVLAEEIPGQSETSIRNELFSPVPVVRWRDCPQGERLGGQGA